MKVKCCLCYDTSFDELKEIIEESGVKDYDELSEICPVGQSCGICIDYIEEIFETGETEFDPH